MDRLHSLFFKEALPGIIVGFLLRREEITKCLFSTCESNILKMEKLLLHSASVMGYVTPGRLMWEILKTLLSAASVNIANMYHRHPNWEKVAKMGLSVLEQTSLFSVWEYIRDGTICLRFNNCESDFLGQLNNIKIKACNVTFPFNDKKEPTLCEQLYNDSPLILLTVAMLVLSLIASTRLAPVPPPVNNARPPAPPNNAPPPQPSNAPPPQPNNAPPAQPNNGQAPQPNNAPPPQPNNRQAPQYNNGPGLSTSLSILAQTHHLQETSDPKDPEQPLPGPSTDPKPNKSPPTPSKPTQVIHAVCPNCSKTHYMTVPRPWEICCRKTFAAEVKKDSSRDNLLCQKVIEELFKEIKCDYCKDKLKKKLIELAKQKQKQDAKKKGKKGRK